jgi:hypothetical protein
MQLLHAGRLHTDIRLSWDGLRLINNALNEVCHGIDVPDLDTRLGARRGEARALLDQIGAVIDQRQGADRSTRRSNNFSQPVRQSFPGSSACRSKLRTGLAGSEHTGSSCGFCKRRSCRHRPSS